MTDEAPSRLKRLAESVSSVRVLVLIVFSLVAAGWAAYAATDQFARKADVARQFAEHAASTHPQSAQRIEALETWRAVQTAEQNANTWWIKQSIGALLDERRIVHPPDPVPVTPGPSGATILLPVDQHNRYKQGR